MLSDVQLSSLTVESRISDNNMVIESQLHHEFQTCEYFSVEWNESCDIQNKPQLAIFALFISNDCLIRELLDIVSLKDRIHGIDGKAMMVAIEKANLSLTKPTAIITDGVPAMIGSVNRLVGMCKDDQAFPEF